MKAEFDIKEASCKLNSIRLLLGNKVLNETDFRKELREAQLPSSTLFWAEIVKAGIVYRLEGGYQFVNFKTPIYFGKLQLAYDAYRNRACTYAKRHYRKQCQIKQLKSKEVADAVKLLTGLGFQIYSPVGALYAKL